MPIYEYKCDACGRVFEKRQSFSDAPLTAHEECGSGPVHRLLSAPALQFKGSGFYITDYAKSSNSPAPKASGGSSSSSESKSSSSSSESKGSSSSSSSSSTSSDKK